MSLPRRGAVQLTQSQPGKETKGAALQVFSLPRMLRLEPTLVPCRSWVKPLSSLGLSFSLVERGEALSGLHVHVGLFMWHMSKVFGASTEGRLSGSILWRPTIKDHEEEAPAGWCPKQ